MNESNQIVTSEIFLEENVHYLTNELQSLLQKTTTNMLTKNNNHDF